MHATHAPRPAPRGIRWPRLYDLLLFGMTGGREDRFRHDVLSLAGIEPGQRVLDVGCGTGTQAVAIARAVGTGGAVTGVDVAPEMLAVARRKAACAGVAVEFHPAEASALPFPDRSFDRVLMCMAMHMVPEAERAACVGELARVLAPGGRLALIDYAGPHALRVGMMARHGLHGRFDLERLRDPVKAAGLQAATLQPMGRLGHACAAGEQARLRPVPSAPKAAGCTRTRSRPGYRLAPA